jgi:hypothetical protein
VAVCAVAVVLGGFDSFFVMFLSLGFLLSLVFKELYRKSEYIFYANNGISKIKLLLGAYFLTFCTTILIGSIIFLIKRLF